jgi:hypothetical protein
MDVDDEPEVENPKVYTFGKNRNSSGETNQRFKPKRSTKKAAKKVATSGLNKAKGRNFNTGNKTTAQIKNETSQDEEDLEKMFWED